MQPTMISQPSTASPHAIPPAGHLKWTPAGAFSSSSGLARSPFAVRPPVAESIQPTRREQASLHTSDTDELRDAHAKIQRAATALLGATPPAPSSSADRSAMAEIEPRGDEAKKRRAEGKNEQAKEAAEQPQSDTEGEWRTRGSSRDVGCFLRFVGSRASLCLAGRLAGRPHAIGSSEPGGAPIHPVQPTVFDAGEPDSEETLEQVANRIAAKATLVLRSRRTWEDDAAEEWKEKPLE